MINAGSAQGWEYLRHICQEVCKELTSELNPENYEERNRRKYFIWRKEQAVIIRTS